MISFLRIDTNDDADVIVRIRKRARMIRVYRSACLCIAVATLGPPCRRTKTLDVSVREQRERTDNDTGPRWGGIYGNVFSCLVEVDYLDAIAATSRSRGTWSTE